MAAPAVVASTPAAAPAIWKWQAEISEASALFGVPASWIAAVMKTESGGYLVRRGQPITSRAGAMGLMQLMPATWAELRGALNLGSDPYNPRENILAGTLYLRRMYDLFGYPGMFAAYNAGPERYRRYLAGVTALPAETTAYVWRVTASPSRFVASMPSLQRTASASRPPSLGPLATRLFAAQPAIATNAPAPSQPKTLFVDLSSQGSNVP